MLILLLVAPAVGDTYLTIDGEMGGFVNLEIGQSCTVEVVSTESSTYSDTLIFLNGWVGGEFSLVEIKGSHRVANGMLTSLLPVSQLFTS